MRNLRSCQSRQESHAVFRQVQARHRELRDVRPVPKNSLRPGVLVWAHVPYEGEAFGKLRPAMVVRRVDRHTVVVHPITSKLFGGSARRSVPIVEWAAAGLERASLVCRREVALPLVDLTSIIGELLPLDRETALRALAPPAAPERRAA